MQVGASANAINDTTEQLAAGSEAQAVVADSRGHFGNC
jgi:hypothetical protein